MGLDAAISALATVVNGLSGLQASYTEPPPLPAETVFPFAVTVVDQGQYEAVSSGLGRGLHTIAVEIHMSRTVTPKAVAAAKVWPQRLYDALRASPDPLATVGHVMWPFTYRAGALTYGDEVHYGVVFKVTLKTMEG